MALIIYFLGSQEHASWDLVQMLPEWFYAEWAGANLLAEVMLLV